VPLTRELRLLEIIPGRLGKDQVTHPRNCHDDLANALCGCIATVMNKQAGLTADLINEALRPFGMARRTPSSSDDSDRPAFPLEDAPLPTFRQSSPGGERYLLQQARGSNLMFGGPSGRTIAGDGRWKPNFR
jgi:hypothetical protein